MANVRTASEKSSDWSRSNKGSQGNAANDRSSAAFRSSGDDGEAQNRSSASNFAASALRGLGQFYDMQAATTRAMLRTQTRAAAAFGLPDYSRIFEVADERALHLYSSATENLVSFVNQADGTLTEMPSQLCRLLEQQAIDITERWKDGLEELQQQAIESMQELRELSRQQTDELVRAVESISSAAQSTLREGGEQFRNAVGKGREIAGRQSEAMRREGERFAGNIEEGAQEGRHAAVESAEQGSSRSRHSRAA